jgi:amidase
MIAALQGCRVTRISLNEERTHHAFSDDALGDRDAVGLTELIERGEVSAREIVAAAIARAQKVEPVLHAIAAECFERAVDAAERPAQVEQAASLLADQGHRIEEISIPFTSEFTEDFLVYWGFLAFALRWAGKRVIDRSFDRSKLDGLTIGLSGHFQRNFHRLPGALRRLHRSRNQYAAMFEGHDAMLTPVVSHTTPKLGYLSPEVASEELIERLVHYAAFTPLANATGAPAIALPFGSSDEGLPIAIQLWAAHGDERTLLELAFEIEQAKPWSKIHA